MNFVIFVKIHVRVYGNWAKNELCHFLKIHVPGSTEIGQKLILTFQNLCGTWSYQIFRGTWSFQILCGTQSFQIIWRKMNFVILLKIHVPESMEIGQK